MTFLGKIFTVLILVMSLVFMTFAVAVSATHKNWRMLVTNETKTDKYDVGLVQQLNIANRKIADLQAEKDKLDAKLKSEQAARRSAIAVLETKFADVQQRLAQKEAELQTLQSSETKSAEALKIAEANVANLQKEVAGLRGEIQTAQRDRDFQFNQVVVLTDQLHAARGLERQLQERQKQLLADISDYKRVMDKFGLKPGMDVDAIAVAPLDGLILAVGANNLVEISLGTDDGVRVGHRFEMFRENNYLGYCIVEKANPDRSVARIDQKSQRGSVKVNDRVATKLGRSGTS